jgi:hypothetical protein
MPLPQPGRASLLALGAVAGFGVTLVAAVLVDGAAGPLEALGAKPYSAVFGALSGVLVAHLGWTLVHPAQIGRVAINLAAANCAAWLLYVAMTPPLPAGEDPALRLRAGPDAREAEVSIEPITAPSDGMDLFHDGEQSLLAGRLLNWVELPQKPLGLFAGPAVVFVEEQMLPEGYWQTGATVSESYWIAAIAFVLSMAWWIAVPGLISWVVSARREFLGTRATR